MAQCCMSVFIRNIMDVIGFDIHNFTRTVTDDKTLEIHTKYINLPMVPIPSWCTHPETASNTMHAMRWQVEDMITLSTFLA